MKHCGSYADLGHPLAHTTVGLEVVVQPGFKEAMFTDNREKSLLYDSHPCGVTMWEIQGLDLKLAVAYFWLPKAPLGARFAIGIYPDEIDPSKELFNKMVKTTKGSIWNSNISYVDTENCILGTDGWPVFAQIMDQFQVVGHMEDRRIAGFNKLNERCYMKISFLPSLLENYAPTIKETLEKEFTSQKIEVPDSVVSFFFCH